MKNLILGYAKFQNEIYPEHRELFQGLKSGQTPETLIISCSDSRVDLNWVTQAKPGQIFHVRNAGNLVPPAGVSERAASGAIEFAVANMPVRDIVVCGHSDCGAMKGLKNGVDPSDDSELAQWLRLAASQIPDASELDLDTLIRVNVVSQIENLGTHPLVAERVAAGSLRLWGWLYDIASSEILQLDTSTKEFVPLGAVGHVS